MIDPEEIPDFNNREEEAEFFDTHDFTEFWQEGTPVKPRRTYSEAMQVRLDPETDHELQALAEERGVKKSTLARIWLIERIRQERNRHAS
jgi:predicted HicB family RNase H-like nuclease